MSALPHILDESRRRDVALVALLGVLQAGTLGLGVFATRHAFVMLHRGDPPSAILLVGLVLAGCLVALFQLLHRIRAEAIGQSFAKALRRCIYGHLAGMNDHDLSRRRLGALSLRFVGDLSAARAWAGLGIARLASAAIVLPGAALTLYLINPALAVAGMAPIGLSLAFALLVAMGLADRHRDLRARRARVAIAMIERVRIASALDLSGRTAKELNALDRGSEAIKSNAVQRIARLALLRLIPQAGAAMGAALVLWTTGAYGLAAADAAATLAMLTVLILPLRELTGVWDRFCAWRIARDKCLRLFQQNSTRRRAKPRGRPVSVVFEDVLFQGLHIDVRIPAGSCVQLSGPAGSGKSAVLSLIAGRNRPERGRIFYDGQCALPRISFIGDTPMIMQGSLRRNAALGIRRRPSDQKIIATLRAFELSVVLERTGGLDGRVGENGRSLSNGEALRLELARATLTKPDLIVIDCAKLSADPSWETLIQKLRDSNFATLIFSYGSAERCRDAKLVKLQVTASGRIPHSQASLVRATASEGEAA